jgi:hypothetical protein
MNSLKKRDFITNQRSRKEIISRAPALAGFYRYTGALTMTGLTFEEYVELKLMPPKHVDRAFVMAAEHMRDEAFPMSLAKAAWYVRTRGYDCRPQSLELLGQTANDCSGGCRRLNASRFRCRLRLLKAARPLCNLRRSVARSWRQLGIFPPSAKGRRRTRNWEVRHPGTGIRPTLRDASCSASRRSGCRYHLHSLR